MIKRHWGNNPLARGIGWSTLSVGTVGLAHDMGVVHGVDCAVAKWFGNPTPPMPVQLAPQAQLPAPGSNQVLIPVPANTPGAVKIGNMAYVSGLGNRNSLSQVNGLGNRNQLSGDETLADEYNNVRSLGL